MKELSNKDLLEFYEVLKKFVKKLELDREEVNSD